MGVNLECVLAAPLATASLEPRLPIKESSCWVIWSGIWPVWLRTSVTTNALIAACRF